jgi:hypothetical protein
VPLVRWADLTQKYRYKAAANPGVPMYIVKCDLKAFFRQIPLRRADFCRYAQRCRDELGVEILIVHTSSTFGGRSALHNAVAQGMAVLDALSAIHDVDGDQFVDDWFVIGPKPEVERAQALYNELTDAFDLERHPIKVYGPAQRLPVLGVDLDVGKGRAYITEARKGKLARACEHILGRSWASVGDLQKWAGLCIHLSDLIPSGRTHTAPVWHLLYAPNGHPAGHAAMHKHAKRTITDEVRWCAEWWSAVARGEGPITTPLDIGVNPERGLLHIVRVRTDAATELGTGVGAVVFSQPGYYLYDPWSPEERALHNNTLELVSIVIAVCTAAPLFTGSVCVVETDNTTALTALRKEGSGSPLSMALAMLISYLQDRFRFFLRVHYVKGSKNQGADGLSRDRREASLPRGPGWDWKRLSIPPQARRIGTDRYGALLPPPSLGPHLLPPPRPHIWARTLTDELVSVSTATYGDSAWRAQVPIPFIPYHPAWQTRFRDALGQWVL